MSKFFSSFLIKQRIYIFFRTTPLASFYDARQGTTKMDYSQGKKIMMTVGTDRTIKVNKNKYVFRKNSVFFFSRFGICHPLYEDKAICLFFLSTL